MLSANSSLTQKQVRELIQYTAKDLGSPGWDKKYGWGRINAKYAVETAARKFTTSGEMTDKEWWWGTVTVDGDLQIKSDLRILSDANIEVDNNAQITVKEGATLKIEPGTEVDFGEDAKLVVEGSIEAGESGTNVSKVNFNFTGKTGGIVMNASQPSYFKNVNISGADKGIELLDCDYSSMPHIRFVNFTNNRIGLKINNSVSGEPLADIVHCNFAGNYYGVNMYNSELDIFGSTYNDYGKIKNNSVLEFFYCTLTLV